jgi:transglutaminase-like putative cysteine protease/predicted glutamine amidotransferase
VQQLNSDLLAICYDSPASPTIRFKKSNRPDGWGFAWYPRNGVGASVLKDPHVEYDTAVATAVQRWDRFRSSIFICHSGTHRGRSFTDTHPFVRSHAGRDWIFAHNGELGRNLNVTLPLEEGLGFEPVGHTDSEHAFCWLMGQVRAAGARSLSDVGWDKVHGWLKRLNDLGTFNAIWSDGLNVVAYHDRNGFNALHCLRRVPPPSSVKLESDLLELDASHAIDENRTFTIIATRPLSNEQWSRLAPGEMRVVSHGQLITTREMLPLISPEPAQANGSPRAPGGTASPQLGVTLLEEPFPSVAGAVLRPIGADRDKSRTYQITHETHYRYQTPVETSTHTVRLQPVRDLTQDVLEYKLEISPPGQGFSYEDVFGNHVLSFQINQPYTDLWVKSVSTVRVHHANTHSSLRSTNIPLLWMPWQRQMMNPFLLPPELPETELRELSGFAMSFAARRAYDLLETLIDLNEALHRDFKYLPGATTLETSPFDVYTERRGVCQDFANLFICLARLLGVPARYRVGYIHTGATYHNQIQSEASHAWAEVYLPSVGWRGFDPTNGCLVDLDHVRVAAGRNFRDATPTAGTLYAGGHGEKLEVTVRVTELEAEPPSARVAQEQTQQ